MTAPAQEPEVKHSAEQDAQAVAVCRAGQKNAYESLIGRHFGTVFAIGLARLGDRERAEELAQDVFVRAWLLLDRLDSPERFGAWVARMAHNLAIDWLRRGASASRVLPMIPLDTLPQEPPSRAATPSEAAAQREESGLLHKALARLGGEQRELILLHYMENLSQQEIADRMGVHPATVSRRMKGALGRLRTLAEPFLREHAASMKARPQAAYHAVGIIAATAALAPSAKSALVATAAQGLKAAATASAWGASPSAGITSLLHALNSYLNTGGADMIILKKVTVAAVLAVMIGGGAGAILVIQAGTQPVTPTSSSSMQGAAARGAGAFLHVEQPVGRRIVTRSRVSSQTSGPVAQPPMIMEQDISVTYKEQRADGGKAVEMEFLIMRIFGADGQTATYDSSKADASPTPIPGTQQAILVSIYQALIGQKVLITYGADNKVEKIEGTTPILDSLYAKVPAAILPMIRTMVSEENLKQMFSQGDMMETFPDRELQIGDTWTQDKSMSLSGLGTMALSNDYRFEGWGEYAGRKVARISCVGAAKMDRIPQAAGVKVEMTKSQITASFEVDATLGMALQGKMLTEMGMTMQMPRPQGEPTTISMTIQHDQTFQIQEVSDDGVVIYKAP